MSAMKKLIIGGLAALAIVGVAPTPTASADPGCQTMLWGFLGSQRRTICDGPIRPDGSWMRYGLSGGRSGGCRRPAGATPAGAVTGRTPRGTREVYPVNPTSLPDEPGHLVGF